MEKKFKRTTVTSALPYANGPVHIGHLAGVYVPADIYVRYLRLKKEDVLFIGGSDEHGVPITIRAKKEGITPQDVVDRYHKIIKDSFEEFGISFDVYGRTTSEVHCETASEFFRTLYDKGEFVEKTSMQYYDEEAHTFLADRYITGECPHCHAEGAYGDQCEKCGTSLSPTDLINPKSAISGSKPVMRETKHWYLPLDKHEAWLRQWILEDHKEWRNNVYGQCKSWLDMGLQPRAVSRDLDWGIPVPVEGAEGKVLYVWFDAPIGYISNTKELLPDSWEKWWKDPETRLVHFIGKDNIVFHCIVFPAMLKAEGSYILPDNVPSNEFLNLEGDKISTSRNWAVWLHEYLRDFPGKQDVLRYVEIGVGEGARLLCGGKRLCEGDFAKGCFMRPTILADARNDMRIAQEEIFGPVATVIRFHTEEEVIELANQSPYGLGGGVWTQDINRALRVARAVETGRMWVNNYGACPAGAPFGGYKESGIGRETHKMTLAHYSQVKNIMISLSETPEGYF